jgi:hypothetical protein
MGYGYKIKEGHDVKDDGGSSNMVNETEVPISC